MIPRLPLCTVFMTALLTAPAFPQQRELKPGWKMIMSPFPASLILKGYDSGEKLPEGVRLVKGAASEDSQLDIRGWLQANTGVTLPAGGMAILQRNPTFVVIVAPDAVADVLEPVFNLWASKDPAQVRIVATLAEFENDPRAKMSDLPYQQLRPLAGPTWKALEVITATTKSAERTVVRQRSGEANPVQSTTATPRLAPGEEGTAFQAEPTVATDLESIDVTYEWQRRLGQGGNTAPLDSTGTLSLKDGVPAIAGRWLPNDKQKEPGGSGKARVLVLRAEIVNASGTPLREAFQTAISELKEKNDGKSMPKGKGK